MSKIEQSVGRVSIADGTRREGVLDEKFNLGPSAFSFGVSPLPGFGSVSVTNNLNPDPQEFVQAEAPSIAPVAPFSVKGGAAHLDEYRVFEKQANDATLKIVIDPVLLNMVDTNGPLEPEECPTLRDCDLIRTVVGIQIRAYTIAGGKVFFNVGGAIFALGSQHEWVPGVATSSNSRGPLWVEDQFEEDRDAGGDGTGSRFRMRSNTGEPFKLPVPLSRVPGGALFAVHITLDATAVDDRGLESAASALIGDPQHPGPGLTARGLTPRGVSKLKEPPIPPRPPARCPAGRSPRAGTLQLSAPVFTAGEGNGSPLVLVTRTGGSRGAASAVVTTSGGTAQSGVDFKPTRTLVRFENRDTSPRLVEVPILEDLASESPESFTVSLSHVRCAKLGKQRSSQVTILDDDQQPPPPPPTFTIGGTVDGLQGSGLVLSNFGAPAPVSANGSFTFPGTVSPGQSYKVVVSTQPTNPEQLCTVENGSGQVSNANVTDVAVHCQTAASPPGLDLTFGGGRVSTPVGGNGQGQAVVIQPTGQIVTAGWRTVGLGIDTDFALTRHNADGSLDTSFGSGGVATTDLGGPDDQALDAALLPDNGIVAVGRTDASGILKTAFGVVRYLPDGTPNPNFDTDGIVTTPFFGKGAGANAVAVQPDGKILVAGFAEEASGFNSDFALARYNPDGALDTSFDGDGIVTTDLSGQDDDARAVVIQPDGRIVVAGTAGEDIALARYMPDGKLDTGFGSGGIRTTDLGFVDVANGVALTPSGQILIAGYTIGAKLNNDFLLARYGSNGALDTSFGSGGTVKTDISGADDFAEDLVVDAAGRIIVVGRASSSTILDMALVRYNPDGTPDPGFDGDGILTADFHGRGDLGQDVALDAKGRIVAAGYTADGSGTEFALMRVNP